MNNKRFFPLIVIAALMIVGFLIYSLVKMEWDDHYPGPPPSTSHFNTYELTLINPATVLDDIHNGKPLVLQIQPEPNPDNPPFIMPIRWSQNDFLEVAQAYGKVIWQDDLNLWHLNKISLYKKCDSSDGKFTDAEFLYYQEVTKGKENLYSVRGIDLSPEYGQLRWGGDTYYPRPLFGWKAINLKEVTVTAEEALRRAEASGGMKARQSWENKCKIFVALWPQVFGRYDWQVDYWDNDIFNENRNKQFWIPTK